MIVWQNLHHFVHQWEANFTCTLSCAWHWVYVIALYSEWIIAFIVSFFYGQCNYYCFHCFLTTLNWKPLNNSNNNIHYIELKSVCILAIVRFCSFYKEERVVWLDSKQSKKIRNSQPSICKHFTCDFVFRISARSARDIIAMTALPRRPNLLLGRTQDTVWLVVLCSLQLHTRITWKGWRLKTYKIIWGLGRYLWINVKKKEIS